MNLSFTIAGVLSIIIALTDSKLGLSGKKIEESRYIKKLLLKCLKVILSIYDVMPILEEDKKTSYEREVQSNSVITNNSGPAKFVRYNRGSL